MGCWKKYQHEGEWHTLREWSEITGISISTLRRRIDAGWSIKNTLMVKPKYQPNPRGPARSDLTGRRYGMLQVLEFAGRDRDGHTLWLCKCDCGNERVISSRNLRYSKSCGCKRARQAKGFAISSKQPCWTCNNYIDGCSWSRKEHQPVDGWIATPVTKYNGARSEMNTFAIHFCPEYVPDGTEDLNDE